MQNSLSHEMFELIIHFSDKILFLHCLSQVIKIWLPFYFMYFWNSLCKMIFSLTINYKFSTFKLI